MRIIAISGKKRSGKDTVASIISANFESGIVRIGFATALKLEVCRSLNISLDYLEQNKANFRLILQGWGTDYRRKLHGDNYWIEKLRTAINNIQTFNSCKMIIVTDVRFKNELEFMRSVGATTVRVNRPTAPSNDTHPSETELDNEHFDIVINNDGTIEQLIQQVQEKIPL